MNLRHVFLADDELLSLSFHPSNPELHYSVDGLQKMVVGQLGPPFGRGMVIAFGSTAGSDLSVECPAAAREWLLDALFKSLAYASESAGDLAVSTLTVSVLPDDTRPTAVEVQLNSDRSAVEIQLTKGAVFARVSLDFNRAKTLVSVLRELKEGFNNVRIIL